MKSTNKKKKTQLPESFSERRHYDKTYNMNIQIGCDNFCKKLEHLQNFNAK